MAYPIWLFCIILGPFYTLAEEAVFEAGHDVEAQQHDQRRDGKFLSVFQVMQFENDICSSATTGRNGTCYTQDECTSRGGVASGSCAGGYGVCCVFSLDCGETSSDNVTYLVKSSLTSLSSNPCKYTICKMSSSITRIKLDFTTFVIADPVAGTAGGTATTLGGAIGDCNTDAFSVTAPGQAGSPVICGFNTGQHMILDASDSCHEVIFDIGASTSTTRSWDIKVIQYEPGDQLAGPDGCLQYFTGTSGTIASYNFPTTASAITSEVTHLSSQHYSICFRRESGYCAICFTPSIQSSSPTISTQSSFGLSVTATGTPAVSHIDSYCSGDYLMIPNAQVISPSISLTIGTVPAPIATRICGKVFSATDAQTPAIAYSIAIESICTQTTPFKVVFYTDEDEVTTSITGMTNEMVQPDTGIVGFKLDYKQQSC